MAGGAGVNEAKARLLDFSKPFDVPYFDSVVTAFYTGQNHALHEVIAQFQQHEQSWRRAPDILQKAQTEQSKIIALNILQNTIKYKWKMLPPAEKNGMKSFVEAQILATASDASKQKGNAAFLTKLNATLIEIVKHEWPHNWPNFISGLVNGSKQSEAMCANNMKILRLLSEEVFGGISQLTSNKESQLKNTLNKEFQEVFTLAMQVLAKSKDPELLTSTLQTLVKFLSWIPVGYIFETSLMEALALKFYPAAQFQTIALECLSEIAAVKSIPDAQKKADYSRKLTQLFSAVMQTTNKFLNPKSNITLLLQQGGHKAQHYVQHLANFLTTFLRFHFKLLETPDNRDSLLLALGILLRISEVRNVELFKITLSFWSVFVKDIHRAMPKGNPMQSEMLVAHQKASDPRLQLYSQILCQLRMIMVEQMVKPKEVLIMQDDNGNVVRTTAKETVNLDVHASIKDCLYLLTQIDPNDMHKQISMKLDQQTIPPFNGAALSTLCWAVGAISNSMSENVEKNFLVHVIKVLLTLCESTRGKENKAVIASNIMYVVRKYPRFLRKHWKFLKTVINKLFEFMHETFPGVQDMAVETYLEIAQKCKGRLIKQQMGEYRAFVLEVLQRLQDETADLEAHQLEVFYEAMGEVISAETNPDSRQKLIFSLFEIPNQKWMQIITTANHQPDSLCSKEVCEVVNKTLKLNIAAASTIGEGYIVQFGRIYVELLHVYKYYSAKVSGTIRDKGELARKHFDVRCMCTVKSSALRLMDTFLQSSNNADHGMIFQKFVPDLLNTALKDYTENHPVARDSDVLTVCTTLIDTIGEPMIPAVPRICEAVLWPTLKMLQQNFEVFPDHRIKFFQLLKSINKKCFQVFFSLSADNFGLVINSIVWAFKHIEKNVAETGLEILLELLNQVENTDAANDFYQKYLMAILTDVFAVLTDTLHKSGFELQAQILLKMFQIVESGCITQPLWKDGQYNSNRQFLRQAVCRLLASAFKHVAPQVIQKFVANLFDMCGDQQKFVINLRDFLIQTKEFQVSDNSQSIGANGTTAGAIR